MVDKSRNNSFAENEVSKESFEDHYRRLEAFSGALHDNKVSIDELIPKLKSALESIKVCKSVLKRTKEQLQEISSEFTELQAGAEGSNEPTQSF